MRIQFSYRKPVLKKARHMPETYPDRQDSEIYGSRLIIYRRSDAPTGGSFSFRAKIDGNKGYIRRTINESNPNKAMILAEQAYEELRVRHKGGFSLKELSVDKFFDAWIKTQKTRLTDSRYRWKQSVYERYVSGFMGNRNLTNLNKKVVDGYWDYRLTFWDSKEGKERIQLNTKRIGAKSKSSHNVAKTPSFATLRAEASLINELLRCAVDDGHLSRSIKISAQDALPKEDRMVQYRDTFTIEEWRVLTSNLYNYALCRGRWKDTRINKFHRFQRQMLRTFVLLSATTGLRTGECKNLRWSDFRTDTNDAGNDVLVVSVRGKTSKVRRGRTAVAHSDNIIGVLNEYKEASQYTNDNDLVFYSAREPTEETRPVDLSTNFKNFLKRCPFEDREDGLRLSVDGKARTLYSLRHFFAIQRLQQNVNIYGLATSMGTGVTQIRNHYGRHISGDAFINELTKNESKTGNKAKGAAVRELVDMVESGVLDEELAMEAFRRVAETR
jgi:integrase